MPSTTSPTGNKQGIVTTFSNSYRGQKAYVLFNASIDFVTITSNLLRHDLSQLVHKITSQSRSTKYYKTKAFAYNRVVKCSYNYNSSSYPDGHFKIPHLWPPQNPPPVKVAV